MDYYFFDIDSTVVCYARSIKKIVDTEVDYIIFMGRTMFNLKI